MRDIPGLCSIDRQVNSGSAETEGVGMSKITSIKNAQVTIHERPVSVSGQVPDGDCRLTANIRADLHMKLKMTATIKKITMGELIENLIENYL